MLTKNNIESIISKTINGNVKWIKSENLDCFDCEIDDYGVIICRFKFKGEEVISVYFTDDWGNISAESEFKDSDKDPEFFNKLNSFYNKVEKEAIIEYH